MTLPPPALMRMLSEHDMERITKRADKISKAMQGWSHMDVIMALGYLLGCAVGSGVYTDAFPGATYQQGRDVMLGAVNEYINHVGKTYPKEKGSTQ